jgi:capsule polysaccharide export protein KpsE/RkpR
MPLRGTPQEAAISRPDTQELERAFPTTPHWIDAVEYALARWRRLAFWTVVAALLATGLSFFICKFQATTQIMPPDSNSGGGLATLLPMLSRTSNLPVSGFAGDLLGVKSTGALFSKVLQSQTVLDNQIDRFDLMKRFGLRYRDKTREKLMKRTDISEDKKSGVITVTYKDHDPVIAQQIANAYVEELNKVLARVSTSSARREKEFIEQRLSEEKKTLDDAEQRFSSFASKSMALDVPQQTRVQVEAVARLQGELIAARGELQSLQQIYADENPRVKSVRARISELERELAKLNTGAGSVDSANPYPPVSKLPSLGVQWTDLYRDTKIHETVYEMLTQQYESARIQEAKETPTAKVLDFASVPERRTPSPILVIVGGGLVGLLLAIFGVLLQRWWSLLPASAAPRMLWNTVRRRPEPLAWK